MKKIAFFDIDGTIYSYGKKVPKDTIEAIRRFRDKGNLAFICTGRTKSMIYNDIIEIGFDGIIAGAGTYLEIDNKIIYQYELQEEKVKSIIEFMRKNNIMAIPEGIEAIYFDLDYLLGNYKPIYEIYCKEIGERAKGFFGDIDNYSIKASKVSGEILEGGNLEELLKKYEKEFNIVMHGNNFIEMIPRGFSKAFGIEKTIRILDIDIENTYAFGDGMNDYEMLNFVKNGYVMGNATEEFKAMFENITDAFDKGGIYNAMKKHGLI